VLGGHTGFIDRSGKMVIEPQFDLDRSCIWPFSDRLRPTPKGGKWGYIDRAGTTVIPTRYLRVDLGFVDGFEVMSQRCSQ
jgi:hypothetical protein